MESSIDKQLRGSAAETANITPNPTPNLESKNQMNHHHTEVYDQDDTPVSLKTNAERFKCYLGTLKSNVKNGRLPALQESPKAPYLAKPSDVEKLLRETPGIASVFHPAESVPPGNSSAAKPNPKSTEAEPASAPVEKHEPVSEPETNRPSVSDAPVQVESPTIDLPDAEGEHASPPASDTSLSSHPSKRRRRRGRGRGKSGAVQSNPSGIQPLALKALAGTTPQERLRITACLNELAGLVASA